MIDGEEHRLGDRHSAPVLDLDRLKAVSALGRGAKGVVFLARDEEVGEVLALKVILRDSTEKKSKENKRVFFERQVLSSLNHPLLPRLRGVLVTEKVVGYAIDYCPGRDLHSLRKKQTEEMFSDDIIRFYAAELVLALEYLHNLGIVYRDLKPDNIMIQENGHIMLVDFDLSAKLPPRSPQSSPSPTSIAKKPKSASKKRNSPFSKWCNSGITPEDSDLSIMPAQSESDSTEKSNSFVGTEEYVAPEVLLGNGHDFAVDWWSLGVVLYEMLYGRTPFRGSNRKETFYRILAKSPELVGEATLLRDLIRKLLEKDPKQRIALEEIKGHRFFSGIDWEMVLQMARPPYIPAESEDPMPGEGIDGIKKIDVEFFVQDIFSKDDDDENENHDRENNNRSKNMEKGVWVEGKKNPLSFEADKFSVF
ncbi:hypothetical protein SLEP1_g545 [Rubroshorea leprosula]|uniref:non-specific serine/threonine protein kinase n=1 Tax=Rubroshorea leprosula TaxID=152421 RepID=A0AAV5HJM6_9ROSI|nr:hypothetical protein SLEP1_g545 [Rubroshorea leprosula]